MPPVNNTYGSLQSALLEGLARATPAVAEQVLPHLLKLLSNLDVAAPAIAIAARGVDLLVKRKSLPNTDAIVGAFSRAAKEVANTTLARDWLKRKPFWRM